MRASRFLQAGYYLKDCSACKLPELGNECVSCGKGTKCQLPGVTLQQLPLEMGYWRVTSTSTDVLLCRVKEACDHSGSVDPTTGRGVARRQIWAERQCSRGYRGPLCGGCAKDYYRPTSDRCKRCDGSEWQSWLGLAIVLAVSCATFGYLLLRNGGSYRREDAKPGCVKAFFMRLLQRAWRLTTKFRHVATTLAFMPTCRSLTVFVWSPGFSSRCFRPRAEPRICRDKGNPRNSHFSSLAGIKC